MQFILDLALLVLLSIAGLARADTNTGEGNARASQIASQSPLVQSYKEFLVRQAGRLNDADLRRTMLDLINNPNTCIEHRRGVTRDTQIAIVAKLVEAGLLEQGNEKEDLVRIFPPFKGDLACPHLPQSFDAAPGGVFADGHHSYPGGLVIHEAFDLASSLSLAADYVTVYRAKEGALPLFDLSSDARMNDAYIGLPINQYTIIAAPIWHDWAKTL